MPTKMLRTFAYDGSGVALRREVEVHVVNDHGAVILDRGKVHLVPVTSLTAIGTDAPLASFNFLD